MNKYITAFIAIFIIFSASPVFAACTNPAKAEGVIIYNSDHKVAQFCNGTDWIGIAGGATSIMTGDTMVDGWPDVIACNVGTNTYFLYQRQNGNANGNNSNVYADPLASSYIEYNDNGTYKANTNYGTTDCVTSTKSIAQLYTDGQAFNFVGSQPVITDTLSDISCTDGQMVLYDTASTAWVCADVSASGAADDLGNHTATQNLDLANFEITNAAGVTLDSVTGGAAPSSNFGRISGEIQAFDLTSCPTGWSEYTAARGRFLRGIDNGAGNDPAGTRAAGNVQTDAFQGFKPIFGGGGTADGSPLSNGTATYPIPWKSAGGLAASAYWGLTSDGTNGTPRTANETRPKNVAVLYCRKD
jgi:hypothetical protein